MASVMTTHFVASASHADSPPFSLIEQKGLLSRLIGELAAAFRELSRDPRGFIRDLVSASGKDAKRRQRIYLGLGLGVAVHVALLAFIAVLGWRTMVVKQTDEQPPEYRVIFPEISSIRKTESTEVPKGEAGGGGGGGQNTPTPASKGQLPKFSLTPPIIAPRPEPTPRPPSLPVPETVQVDPRLEPKRDELAATGLPNGVPGPVSAGPGSGGGMGDGSGASVGPGSRGGKNGGPAGSPDGSDGSVSRAIDFTRIPSFPGYRTWSWIHRQRAMVTPEAAENKVIGNVLLRATFNADGTITDIEVVMPVDFMNESAVEALRRSTFHPATINGVPVTVRRVPIKESVHY
jgi:TonB family protein